MKTLFPLVALAALLPLVPAAAATPARSQVVDYRDLDLASADGRATLDRRIARAADDVCGAASDADLAGQNAVRRCRAATVAVALGQVETRAAALAGRNALRIAAVNR